MGTAIDNRDFTLKVDEINADEGSSFTIQKITRLQAINNLLKVFSVTDQGKDTGMLNLTLVGEDPNQITNILNTISDNYLAQNIHAEAAQDEKV